jgi:hypothetical protein
MDAPAGLNSGSTKSYDEAALWQNAIGPRLNTITETANRLILSRYAETVGRVTLHTKSPTFDDDSPRYDQAAKSTSMPLRNVERRDILGLPPLGDSRDDEVWLPINMVPAFQAPPSDPDAIGKARLSPRQIASMRTALHTFMQEQAERVGRLMEKKSAAVERKPNDPSPYWNEAKEDELLAKVLSPFLVETAVETAKTTRKSLGVGKAEVFVQDEALPFDEVAMASALKRVGKRITLINKSTLQRIREMVAQALEAGASPAELGRGLRGEVDPLPTDKTGQALKQRLGNFGSELRAETIARTEMRLAQNGAQVDTYGSHGVTMVRMDDGDEDAACAARNAMGPIPIEEAQEHMEAEHPNGTLSFIPISASIQP